MLLINIQKHSLHVKDVFNYQRILKNVNIAN